MDIINIFYDEVVKEATHGRVNCGFIYNVAFNSIIEGNHFICDVQDTDLQIPTLYISNKQTFNSLLVQYVDCAKDFYDMGYYDNEHDYIKALLTFLITNMTAEEFIEPINYIRKRIAFLQDVPTKNIEEYSTLGVSSYLGEIQMKVSKEPIYDETPYSLKFSIDDSVLPTVRFGIDADKVVYIYAIQNERDSNLNKKVNRLLYKVNENFDTSNESFDNLNDYENLTGISPSAVSSATLALAYFLGQGYTKIKVSSFLPIRYNAKVCANKYKVMKDSDKNHYTAEETQKLLSESKESTYNIQRNISDKLIRTFRRIDNHFNNIIINSYPFDVDSYLHLTMNDRIYCNNPLLDDLFTCGYNQAKVK